MDESNLSGPRSDEHDTLYKEGVALVRPYLKIVNAPRVEHTARVTQSLKAGIAKLNAALEARPDDARNASTHWAIGKAYEAMGDHEESYRSFRQSFALNLAFPTNGGRVA